MFSNDIKNYGTLKPTVVPKPTPAPAPKPAPAPAPKPVPVPTPKPTPAPVQKASGHPVVDIGGKSYPVNKQTMDVDRNALNRDLANNQLNYVNAQARGDTKAMATASQQGAELKKAGATVEISSSAVALGNYYKNDTTVKKAMETKSVADLNEGILKAKNDYQWAQQNNDKAGMEAAARLAENFRSLGGTISANATLQEAKNVVYTPPKPPVVTAPVSNTSSNTLNLARGFATGLLDGAKTAIGETISAIQHPIDTAKGLGNAIMHPIDTGKAIVNNVKTGYDQFVVASPEKKAEMLGSGTSQLIIGVAGTKGATAAVTTTKELAQAGIKSAGEAIEVVKVFAGPQLVSNANGTLSILPPQSKVTDAYQMARSVQPSSSNTVTQTVDKAKTLETNKATGKAFEEEAEKRLSDQQVVVGQITLQTQSGVRTRVDFAGIDKESGQVQLTEAKSSATAPLTKNQKQAFPEIEMSGATVVGKGKPPFTGGVEIPPTKVEIVRPETKK